MLLVNSRSTVNKYKLVLTNDWTIAVTNILPICFIHDNNYKCVMYLKRKRLSNY